MGTNIPSNEPQAKSLASPAMDSGPFQVKLSGARVVGNPTLEEAARLSREHVMSAAEIRAQRISFIVGMTGYSHEKVADWLDRHEGRK